MKLLITILIIVFTNCSIQGYAQWVRPKDYYKVVDSIRKINDLDVILSKIAPLSGFPPVDTSLVEWHLYNKLRKLATTEQLITLTNSSNTNLKCYAFKAIVENKSGKYFQILLDHLHDTSIIYFGSGCVPTYYYTGDYFFNEVTTTPYHKPGIEPDENQRRIIDSILIYDSTILLNAKSFSLSKMKPRDAFYEKIKNLASQEKNEAAFLALARFKKSEDKLLIASFLLNEKLQTAALKAVEIFPDKFFYPYIKTIFETDWKAKYYNYGRWHQCYVTLAMYPSQETLEFFERTISSKDDFRYKTLGTDLGFALLKHPHPLFDSIKRKLNEDKSIRDELKSYKWLLD